MKKFFQKPRSTGMPPGTLISSDRDMTRPVQMTIFEYGPDRPHVERQAHMLDECFPIAKNASVAWVNLDGLHQVELLEGIGDHLGIHPLVLEDILNTAQRPKMEDFEHYLFLELNMLYWEEEQEQIGIEQVSMVLGENYVFTFQESERDVFDPIRKRIREENTRITKNGADYLAYSLIDAIVDAYFLVLENISEQIEYLEEELITDPDPETLNAIHTLKRELIFLRKSVWPLREVIGSLERGETPLFQHATLVYMRDLYDHTIQIIDTVETFRDIVSGMLDIYLSSVSNRMNEVMKVLTIIATIFIPLSFIVGVYGMNFEYMPELQWRWGYFVLWGVMIAIVVSMLVYFRKRKWI